MSFLAVAAAILAGAAAGTGMLRRAWQSKAGKTPWRMGGLALLAFTVIWPAWPLGPVRGPFIAITLISLAAWAVVSSGYKRRPAKAQRAGRESLAPEPAERLTTKWRTTLRWLLAGPIGMVAAMAVGISYTVWAPGADQTRLLIGALIVPVVWGGAMAWTLADNRIVRATAVLTGTAVIGFGLSMLKGFA
ncbi:hypothetical protein [Novosphingobium beihaiensis]|uniref:Uncharacterized protein n=1 Tax=Novosphingobium beihaiensis TaxID=2930389 RepID=A0ABT0BLF4_9SPHN|nr:hypothetical protein [Novosphingobium beihaiensis]MCJ2185790.1 hypothetical protein [Novosphingobium beihaiensis]